MFISKKVKIERKGKKKIDRKGKQITDVAKMICVLIPSSSPVSLFKTLLIKSWNKAKCLFQKILRFIVVKMIIQI